jgi:hypothetical protein
MGMRTPEPTALATAPLYGDRADADLHNGTTPLLLTTDGDDASAGDDERPANQDGQRGDLAEAHSRYDLRQEEKKNHVHPEQFPKLPAWSVDHQTVCREGDRSAHEGEDAARPRNAIQSRLKAGVAVGFQKCSE